MKFSRFQSSLTALAGGLKPRIKSLDDLSLALRWISRLKSHADAVDAQRRAEVNSVNEAAAAAQQIDVGDETVPLEQFESALQQEIERFVPGHKPDIFTDGKQTARFPAGEVSWSRRSPTVALADGVKASDIAERLAKRAKLHEGIAALLEEAGLADRLRVEFKLDLSQIKRQFADKQIRKSQLPTGLEVTSSRDDVKVKPYIGPERSDHAD